MTRTRWISLPVLAAWTLLIWGTRIDNIWSEPDLSAAGRWGRTLLAVTFVLAGLAVAVEAARTFRRSPDGRSATVLAAVGIWTTAVWVVRSVQIVLADHSVGFVAVHLVLAVVSVALAGWAWRAVTGARAPESPAAVG